MTELVIFPPHIARFYFSILKQSCLDIVSFSSCYIQLFIVFTDSQYVHISISRGFGEREKQLGIFTPRIKQNYRYSDFLSYPTNNASGSCMSKKDGGVHIAGYS